MVRIIYIYVIALFLTLTACQKVHLDTAQNNGLIVLSASTEGASQTKVGLEEQANGSIKLSWQNNDAGYTDSFSVYNSDGNYVGDFIYIGKNGDVTGDFVQTEEFSMPNGVYTAVFPAVDGTIYNTLSLRNNMTLDDYTQTNNSDLTHLNKAMRMSAQFTYSSFTGNKTFRFSHELSLVTLTFTLPTNVTPQSITLRDGEFDYFTLDFDAGITGASGNTYTANFPIKPKSGNRALHFKVVHSNTQREDHLVNTSVEYISGGRYSADIGSGFNGFIPVYNRTDLSNINSYKTGWYRLLKNIDLSGANWAPIGSADDNFKGKLDGNNLGISSMKCSGGNDLGLFAHTEGAEIYDLTLDNPNITSTGSYNGALVGVIKSTTISNVTVINPILKSNGQYLGGVVGWAQDKSVVQECSVLSTLSTTLIEATSTRAGGVVGYIDNSKIIFCNNATSVKASWEAGGVCGYSVDSSKVVACHNTGSVSTSAQNAGGVVAYCGSTTSVIGCYNKGTVTASSSDSGGVIGQSNRGNGIFGCYNDSEVKGSGNLGYLVGYRDGGASITYSSSYWVDNSEDAATVSGLPTSTTGKVTSLNTSTIVDNMNTAITGAGVTGVEYVLGASGTTPTPVLVKTGTIVVP